MSSSRTPRGSSAPPWPTPLPSHSTPRRNTAEGAARAWTHHPHPTLRPTRTLGQPQRTTHPAATRPMALGQHLPERPHQPQKPPTTLLNNPHHTTPRTPKPTSPGLTRPQQPPTAFQPHPAQPNHTDHATKPSQTPPKPTSPPPPHHPDRPPREPIGGFRLRAHAKRTVTNHRPVCKCPNSTVLLAITEIHSYWICPVWWGVAAMIGVAPGDRGAGLTQAKSGACVALLGICRPVPRSRVGALASKRM